MSITDPSATADRVALADASIATVRRWLQASSAQHADPHSRRLMQLLQDPGGLSFARRFVDGVVRPDDLGVAAREFERVSRDVPRSLPAWLRAAVLMGGGFAPLMPPVVVPIARRVMRSTVSHLVVDATPEKLDKSLARLRQGGAALNINLLGEAVLGADEAARRLRGIRALLARSDVDYVSVKVSSVVSQLNLWAFDETVDQVVDTLAPLYEDAAAAGGKFINLDMEEYRDLDLTVAVFMRLLSRPTLRRLEAGIVLQAYLPDSFAALQRIAEWAGSRVADGGAPVKVRLVKGANLPMEHVDAALHGWAPAPYATKAETDANYKRMLEWALTPERAAVVRLGVAGHNLFDIAYAWLLARQRGVEGRTDFEMLLGMAPAQAAAVSADVGAVRFYTPVVDPAQFDSAISYLVRRLEEAASPENFMSSLPLLDAEGSAFELEAQRFRESLGLIDTVSAEPRRTQDRADAEAERGAVVAPAASVAAFTNTPDTDPALGANRAWGRAILQRAAASDAGEATVAASRVGSVAGLRHLLQAAAAAGEAWGARSAEERASALDAVGAALAAHRDRLIEVAAAEAGKTIGEADPEVSEAIDFAHYYAASARELATVTKARFVPPRVTSVIPPWNFPIAIPAGGVLAALAAGSAVVLKPSRRSERTAAVLAELMWEAGIPRDLLVFAPLDSSDLGRELVTDPLVDRVILTGSYDTAAQFRSWRPELDLHAETSGKNAIIVTPSADFDHAVADIVKSAFGHAGQKCSAASTVILVGSVAESSRFKAKLLDAVTSLRVGWPSDPRSVMGPVIAPPEGKLARGLGTLGAREWWMLEPRRLDHTGRLWSPGVRDGVQPGSEYHLTEYFGPVLGLMSATTLDEAIALQNAPAYGLTAGLHSLDPEEISHWLSNVEAGNLYVNRGITGAIVRRQPFGGWKRSSVGPGAKAGGPDYVASLGRWEPVPSPQRQHLRLSGVSDAIAGLIEAAQPGMDYAQFDRARRGAADDAVEWRDRFGVPRDLSGLGVERNVFRYLPARALVRLAEQGDFGDFVRVLAAAATAGATVLVSTPEPLPAPLATLFAGADSPLHVESITVETDAAFNRRMADLAARGTADSRTPSVSRVRMIGGDTAAFAAATGGSPDFALFADPVTDAGRVELLPFLREQAVSITAHRYGSLDRELLDLEL
ncbi:bifunctional proline dehydrogenase/L-glutamate gamma-semialdehyde dehydrogenase [Ruicaihuangia caeni]|uniref:bifunctional proline dehydrogenase/L-glutamate gamma-semialdehyde dehydrogenase n=1 Tax=Ruicaihuangia caeni TaxID=3042517 RepID=UPI00338E05D4